MLAWFTCAQNYAYNTDVSDYSTKNYVEQFSVDKELQRNVNLTVSRVVQAIVDEGINDVAVAYSGGKDSTALLIVVAEIIARGFTDRVKLRVVFSDTKLELPPLVESAFAVLNHFRKFCDEKGIEHIIHLTERPLEQSFWVLMLGKGYPPPNRYFRWCTDRLKVQPPRDVFRTLPKGAALFTGVRADESANRARTLKKGCSADGECGLERWTDPKNQEGLRFFAPMIDWRTCKVWDFLNFWAKADGWPVEQLAKTYGTGATRFGCWTCTLVNEDKALMQVTQLDEWQHLKPLADFRTTLLEEAQLTKNRLHRADGAKGKLTLSFRKQLLNELLELQEKIGRTLITKQEVDLIKTLWQEKMPSVYTKLVSEERSLLDID